MASIQIPLRMSDAAIAAFDALKAAGVHEDALLECANPAKMATFGVENTSEVLTQIVKGQLGLTGEVCSLGQGLLTTWNNTLELAKLCKSLGSAVLVLTIATGVIGGGVLGIWKKQKQLEAEIAYLNQKLDKKFTM